MGKKKKIKRIVAKLLQAKALDRAERYGESDWDCGHEREWDL